MRGTAPTPRAVGGRCCASFARRAIPRPSIVAYENYSLLLGESATPEQERMILHLGPAAVLVSARVWFRPELTAAQTEDAVRRLEDVVRAIVPETRPPMIVIEPARPDAAYRGA